MKDDTPNNVPNELVQTDVRARIVRLKALLRAAKDRRSYDLPHTKETGNRKEKIPDTPRNYHIYIEF